MHGSLLAVLVVSVPLAALARRFNMSAPLALVVAGLAALLIALLTVSLQAIKAAVANPVKSLRTE